MNEQIRREFGVRADQLYFDAATYGLPPQAAVDACQAALAAWRDGSARYVEDWESAGEDCRLLYARLIGADPARICLLPSVSTGIGTVAASLPAGSVVLAAEDEFTSLVLPFAAAGRINQCRLQTVPWEALIATISPAIDVVAVSLTRAQDGRTTDLASLVSAAKRSGVRVIVDATHALPFVPVAGHLDEIDYLVCHAYKHLLSPRGTAFGCIHPRFLPQLAPINANWRTTRRSYGASLKPAGDASAFDVSLAWHAWVGTRPALERLLAWSEDGTLRRSLGLARRLARALQVPEPAAALVCVPASDPEGAAKRLDELGLRAAGRGRYLRLSTHVWNTEDEVDRAAGLVTQVLDEIRACNPTP